MTDIEILESLKSYTSKPEVIDKAIKALKQETKTDVLNKIRVEIIENSIEDYVYHGCGSDELIIGTNEVLNIIDKYKSESENKK